jgi:L-iditol 2-dehydrogenase
MIQAVMNKPGEITFREVPVPPVAANQIKVKMKRIGVCGSDIHVFHGRHPYTSYPVVQGHEVSAIVVDAGADVTAFSAGDRVTIQPQVVCGRCHPCTHGMYNACEELKVMGFQTTGMASEYVVTEASKALKLPDSTTYAQGAMIEPLAVAVHAVRRYGDVTGKKVLVLGGGPIGNLVAQTARAMGAADVLLSELSAYRLETASRCGIKTVNPNQDDLPGRVVATFGPAKADVTFECVGINATMTQAIDYARKGSDIVVVGVFASLGAINMGFVQDHELRLIGTAMYRVEDYIEAIELVRARLIELDALITHTVRFRDYLQAYRIIEEQRDKAMKVMVTFDDEA